jgi:phage-related protein
VNGGQSSFVNSGNVTVFPVITLSGQMLNPQIINITTGQTISLNYYMGSSDVVVIDTDTRAVTLNGNAARNLLANTTEWFGFAPGTTTVGIIVPISVSGASVRIEHRNGYI